MAKRGRMGMTLGTAHDNGYLIRVGCDYCRARRHYLPSDLRTLLGDVPVAAIASRTRCEACGRHDYLQVDAWLPYPAERIGLVVRRLDRVRTVRVAEWRDESLG